MQPNTSKEAIDMGTPASIDVPELDHGSATPNTTSPDTIHSLPADNLNGGLNPQAPWFDFGTSASLDTALLCASPPPPPPGLFGGFGSPPPVYVGDFSSPPPSAPFPNPLLQCSSLASGSASTDDLKLLLLGISARLDAMERAVASAGVQWSRVERDVGELKDRPNAEAAMESLKKSLKEFTTALILEVLGGGVPQEGRDAIMGS